jgi:hypothetical protein
VLVDAYPYTPFPFVTVADAGAVSGPFVTALANPCCDEE